MSFLSLFAWDEERDAKGAGSDSSAVISCEGVCESGKRNCRRNRAALEGFLSEDFNTGADDGSMRDCAFCTRLLRLNMMCHVVMAVWLYDCIIKS